jgi:hypothetical protein
MLQLPRAKVPNLDMVGVTGSIPVAPTIKPRLLFRFWKCPRADLFQLFPIQ